MCAPHWLGVTASDELIRRIEQTWAHAEVEFISQLQTNDPTRQPVTVPLVNGYVVLCGPDLYVNRALAVGLGAEFTDADLDVLESACRRLAVPPQVEVSPASHRSVVIVCARRGYAEVQFMAVLGIVLGIGLPPSPASIPIDPSIGIDAVTRADLGDWQEATAEGWGHDTVERRRASDAFAQAAFACRGTTLFLARSHDDERPLGCAGLSMRSSLATLGAMSTLPAERRRGVQRALVAHRLRVAHNGGCDLAVTSVVPGGASERNLLGLGFVHLYTKSIWASPGRESQDVTCPPAAPVVDSRRGR